MTMTQYELNQELKSAAYTGDIETVRALVESGVPVNGRDDHGVTPLHAAAGGGHKEVAEFLIARGAKVDAADNKYGQQPLHHAALEGKTEVAELLIGCGAKIDAPDRNANQPLHLAAYHARKKMVEFLVAKGAPVDAVNNEGMQPLHMAARGGFHDAWKVVKPLLAGGARVDAGDGEGNQPLHLAAQFHHRKMMSLLLRHGADPGAVNNCGQTPREFCQSVEIYNDYMYIKAFLKRAERGSRERKALAAFRAQRRQFAALRPAAPMLWVKP